MSWKQMHMLAVVSGIGRCEGGLAQVADGAGTVRYVTSADGTAIGYCQSGSGRLIVQLPGIGSALRLRDAVPSLWVLGLGTIVTYDRRGTGFSDRDATDFSMEAAVVDLAAVVDAVSSEPVVVYASWDQGPVAMRYAAEQPDRVSHLVLESTFADGADCFNMVPSMRIVRGVLREDWDYYVRLAARVQLMLDRPLSDEVETLTREETSHETTLAQFEAISTYDATPWVQSITSPTLLIQRTVIPSHFSTHDSLRTLAAQIPSASLVRCAAGEIGTLVGEFVGSTLTSESDGAFRTILFTDLVSSTALTQKLGDDGAQEIVEAHDAAVRDALVEHSGTQIKHTGDGVMAAFASAANAARAAAGIASRLGREGVGVRVGLNAGEPIERDGDLFGTAVQLAARVCDAAADGQVLASQVVRDLTAGKGLDWSPARSISAKGFDEPVPVFALDTSD